MFLSRGLEADGHRIRVASDGGAAVETFVKTDGNYATTLASGTASISTSGSAGLATFEDGALEALNVIISSEFSNLFIAQRLRSECEIRDHLRPRHSRRDQYGALMNPNGARPISMPSVEFR